MVDVQPAEGIERFLRDGGLIVSATGHCEASAEYESGQGYPDLFHVRFPAPKVRANLAVEAASKRQNSAWRSRGAFGQCLRLLRRAGLAGRHLPVRRQPRPQPAEGGASWRSALLWMGRGMSGAMLTPADAYVRGGLSGRWRKGSGGVCSGALSRFLAGPALSLRATLLTRCDRASPEPARQAGR